MYTVSLSVAHYRFFISSFIVIWLSIYEAILAEAIGVMLEKTLSGCLSIGAMLGTSLAEWGGENDRI